MATKGILARKSAGLAARIIHLSPEWLAERGDALLRLLRPLRSAIHPVAGLIAEILHDIARVIVFAA